MIQQNKCLITRLQRGLFKNVYCDSYNKFKINKDHYFLFVDSTYGLEQLHSQQF